LKFLLVGGGPWRQRLESRVDALGLQKHFVFAGLVPPTSIPPLIGVMDALVHLSRREGIARALPQALAAARPVVAYQGDGAAEVCLENETGFLIPPGDRTRLTERLLELSASQGLRERLGRRGQELVRDWFPVERMVNDLEALYQRLSARASRLPPPASP
jgi:glycosyltransferase involved in cell wall biosynthesis